MTRESTRPLKKGDGVHASMSAHSQAAAAAASRKEEGDDSSRKKKKKGHITVTLDQGKGGSLPSEQEAAAVTATNQRTADDNDNENNNPTAAPDKGDLLRQAIQETVEELIRRYKAMTEARKNPKLQQKKKIKSSTRLDVNRIKRQITRRLRAPRQPKLVEVLAAVPEEWRKTLRPHVMAKPIRAASGIAVVAVMCKPHRCPHIAMTGNICVYCPGGPDSDFEYSTQSYTGYEPTSMRAIRSRYDPYKQTRDRVLQLRRLGHEVDKVEFIVMGGTFMSMPADYRDYFIRNLHDALSGHSSKNVAEAVRYGQHGRVKCIGITIETRPDYCLRPHLSQMLEYGCTRLEVGVQSVYEDVALDTNRGHTVRAVSECFVLAKDAGFKIVAHMMPDLPNMGVERDLAQFQEFFENPAFRTDGLKIYPTLVIRGTGLYELWKTGAYKNYSVDVLVDVLAQILALVPPWTRVYRIQRDIPMPLVSSGVERGNIRQLVHQHMNELGLPCRDVRAREIGIRQLQGDHNPQQEEDDDEENTRDVNGADGGGKRKQQKGAQSVIAEVSSRAELVRRDYVANGGWETFLAYEDPQTDTLIGLLRLRQCSPAAHRKEATGQPTSVVRELHVYGSAVPIHARDPAKFQHRGFGTLLMETAEVIARDEHLSDKLLVISGVGTREYYAKLGYVLDGPYMAKWLSDED